MFSPVSVNSQPGAGSIRSRNPSSSQRRNPTKSRPTGICNVPICNMPIKLAMFIQSMKAKYYILNFTQIIRTIKILLHCLTQLLLYYQLNPKRKKGVRRIHSIRPGSLICHYSLICQDSYSLICLNSLIQPGSLIWQYSLNNLGRLNLARQFNPSRQFNL